MLRLAIDAMGGDYGHTPIIQGVLEALKEREFEAILVGKQVILEPLIPEQFRKFVSFEEANEVFPMEESATEALKYKESSIYKVIELLRAKKVDAVLSAGHSGASMSLATLRIGRLKGVLRPAIGTLMPTIDGKMLFLDVGANVDCKSEHLFQFAVMGVAYAKAVMKLENPRLALLSNGEEEGKGNELTKESYKLLQKIPNFSGNAEGKDIFNAKVDVLVCDGFSGNIILKACEGVATTIFDLLKKGVLSGGILAKFGAVLLKPVLKKLKKHIDWREYGGAPLLGINGCVIISHGKSDFIAIKNAVFAALDFSHSRVNSLIENELKKYEN